MIAQAEDILFTARRQPSEVAILYPRSSEMWDGWVSSMRVIATGLCTWKRPKAKCLLTQHTELVDGLCMCCCVSSMVSRYIDYTAEAYGLYLALATDANIPVGVSLSLACEPSRDLY